MADVSAAEAAAAVSVVTVSEFNQLAAEVQADAAKKKEPPLSGVALAEAVHELLPDPAPAGQKYRVAELRNAPVGTTLDADNSVVVVSADGSVEDAIRAYNAGKSAIRTFKQLRIEKYVPPAV